MLSNDFNCTTDLSNKELEQREKKKNPHEEDHFVTLEEKKTMHPYTSFYHPSLSSFINPLISSINASTMPFMHGSSDRFTGNVDSYSIE